jgi:hypothetical protein
VRAAGVRGNLVNGHSQEGENGIENVRCILSDATVMKNESR